ncbi:MAG: hypothetical protein EPO55_00720 [Reyranella sp.]|uniref:hypothetical protein n=1 Tax=Reyranella sp. TaxID=1929291 RepID=UPI0012225FAE|nr:hypothetical protein [Reyranella sp.]TAJ42784.1 MAG: hypothetical protein EPO55_00720 [Reyranella sp.]
MDIEDKFEFIRSIIESKMNGRDKDQVTIHIRPQVHDAMSLLEPAFREWAENDNADPARMMLRIKKLVDMNETLRLLFVDADENFLTAITYLGIFSCPVIYSGGPA